MAQRKRLLVLVTVTAALVGVAAWIVLPARADNSAAKATAQRYVDYVASGDEDDLERLWALTATESGGALRAAGELLVGAEERIEVISVGEPQKAAPPADLGYQFDLEDFVQVEVRYRLAGKEHRWPIVLGKLVGEGGSDVGDWRVVGTMTGSIAWAEPGFTDVGTDVYVSSTRQVRRPFLAGGSDEDVQPLYPAGYRTQARLDPYFASAAATVAVTAGKPVTPPELPLKPTRATQSTIRRQVLERLTNCDKDPFRCPVLDIAERAGADVWEDRDWWLGLTVKPTVTMDTQDITVSDGAFRLRGPQGEQLVRFRGTGRSVLDNQSWKPAVFELDLVEAR